MMLSYLPGRLPNEIVDGPPRNFLSFHLSNCLFAERRERYQNNGVRRIPPALMR
jgi:hypothetical protein